ncbi:extracellular catalytic domain type 2 short-chain-length polyhydroxyalkanoate depolymerase [Derxia lacustris]|uniref:extracellular catalytic domain type 2 short-chain-length polyhydroxyalkanoate depolymerase n=1 Tax=Derxia lacustris TaxID=764842 RepID=UPI00111C14DA|nr:PHB depolymerase family esterase [Derxia lacustris]
MISVSPSRRRALHALALSLALPFAALPLAARAAPPLAGYNVDKTQSSVSGLSAGGFMAVQLGVAYSSIFKGVGVFAGGPYDCAGQRNYTGCMYQSSPSVTQSVTNMRNWSGNQIDPVANIASQRIYLFSGSADTTVATSVMNQVQAMYVGTGNFVSAANLRYDKPSGAAHTFPTDYDSTGNNACGSAVSPYISNCSFDGAGTMLQWIYGTLAARNTGTLGGSLVQFDQTEFIGAGKGMDSTGWAFVPAACAAGQACKVHVALHGCQQGYTKIGDKFLRNTGYNRWADTNKLIVLYPQAVVDNTSHATAASGSLANPNGCFDWIGWYGSNFDQKAGVQMAAIKAMVDRIGSGFTGGGGGGTGVPAVPTGLAATGSTSTSITLAWGASGGATGYQVWRNGTQVGTTTGTGYTDGGLAPATSYSYAVAAVNANGASAQSAPVAASTQAGTAYSQAITDTVVNHYAAGRLTLQQYLTLGGRIGYTASVTLYLCGSTWTNSASCGPFA